MTETISIQIIDDSVVVRGLIRRIIDSQSDMKVVASSIDGQSGVEDYKAYRPDIVLMDIEMPHMDGITALQKILQFDKNAKVIICSSLTQKGAETTYQALDLGAVDFLSKPSSTTIERTQNFEDEMIDKLRAIGWSGKSKESTHTPPSNNNKPSTPDIGTPILRPTPNSFSMNFPVAMVIGSSTGGPRALIDFFKNLQHDFLFPVFVTQHIPEGFSKSLADNIQYHSGHKVHEATHGMLIEPGHIYLAPGKIHMGVQKSFPRRIELIDEPAVNYCKPSIDVMLRSIGKSYDSNMIIVMLTGMGSDGKDGCEEILNKGTHIVLAQDKESSIVWGIPGAVANAGLCNWIGNPEGIAHKVNNLINRKNLA